ncbi:hypothetical protein J2046_006703, partial [Rhizobium petrolearium]|nr:hypothetical protein [Neorhizobium petrolearium]
FPKVATGGRVKDHTTRRIGVGLTVGQHRLNELGDKAADRLQEHVECICVRAIESPPSI